MNVPIPPVETEAALDRLGGVIDVAIAHASVTGIDEQQVAVARLADLATKLRAARDLLAYARGADERIQEQAAVFAGDTFLSARAISRAEMHG